MTSNQRPEPGSAAPVSLEPETQEHADRRKEILRLLENDFAQNSGTVLRLLKLMHGVVASTRPNCAYNDAAHQEACDLLLAIVKEVRDTRKIIRVPDIIVQANQFVFDNSDQLRARAEKAGLKLSPKPDPEAIKAKAFLALDAPDADRMEWERVKLLSRSLGAMDAAPDKGGASDERKVPEDLKNWKKPMIGITNK